jgi:RNA polymerase sigma-70 factor (ECF subfamily)
MRKLNNSLTLLSDEQLMIRIKAKERIAFEVLYDRYSRLMYNYFYRMLWKNKELCKDLTQDLFTKVVLNAAQFDSERSFKTWLYTIAHNMCKNEYAKHEVRMTAQMPLESIVTAESVSRQTDFQSFKNQLHTLIQNLDEVKKQTIELRFFQELSIPEIAQLMKCSEGTVKSRIFYILKDFQSELIRFKEILTVLFISWLS